jgi:hypothetical protein
MYWGLRMSGTKRGKLKGYQLIVNILVQCILAILSRRLLASLREQNQITRTLLH